MQKGKWVKCSLPAQVVSSHDSNRLFSITFPPYANRIFKDNSTESTSARARAHTHTHTHARTHARTHACTHTREV